MSSHLHVRIYQIHSLYIALLFTAYTMAKYGMSMCVLGMSEELKPDGIAVNALWPRTGMAFNTEVLQLFSMHPAYIRTYCAVCTSAF